jgi:hypothetical protein
MRSQSSNIMYQSMFDDSKKSQEEKSIINDNVKIFMSIFNAENILLHIVLW